MVSKELAEKYKSLKLENVGLRKKESDYTFEKKANEYSGISYFERKADYKKNTDRLNQQQENIESADAQTLLMEDIEEYRASIKVSIEEDKNELESTDGNSAELLKEWIANNEKSLAMSDDEIALMLIEDETRRRDLRTARIKSYSLASAIGLRGDHYDNLWFDMSGKIDVEKFSQLTQEDIQVIAKALKQTKYIQDFKKIDITENIASGVAHVIPIGMLAALGSVIGGAIVDFTPSLWETMDSTGFLVAAGVSLATAFSSMGIACLSDKLNSLFYDKQSKHVATLDEILGSLGLAKAKENEEEMAD